LSHYWIQLLLLIGNLSSVGATSRSRPVNQRYECHLGIPRVAPTSSPQQMALYLLELVVERYLCPILN